MPDDQASGLRRLFGTRSQRVLGVIGPDATPIVCDLAHALREAGDRVLVIDRTHGSVPGRMNVRARIELAHVVSGDCTIADALVDTADGITILPAARGMDELALAAGDGGWQARLADWCDRAQRQFDVWIVNGLLPAGSRGEVLVAVEPTAQGLTGAYGHIKALASGRGQRRFPVVVHRADSEAVAQAAFDSIASTARRFLAADLDYRGAIPADAQPPALRREALRTLAHALVPVSPAR